MVKYMTKQYNIKLSNQKEQIEFSNMCNKFSFDINLCKGSYVVDAKSILGICTMDTSDGCCVKINALSTNNKIHEFEENIKNWRV